MHLAKMQQTLLGKKYWHWDSRYIFLVIVLSKLLAWIEHNNKALMNIFKSIGILLRLGYNLTFHILLYKYFVLHVINCAVMARSYKKYPICKKIITRSKYLTHTDPLFQHINLLKYKIGLNCSSWNFIITILLISFFCFFLNLSFKSNSHHYNTRSQLLMTPKMIHAFFRIHLLYCIRWIKNINAFVSRSDFILWKNIFKYI